MKNYTKINNPFKSSSKKNIIAVALLIILPLVFGGIFMVQKFTSSANVVSQPEGFHAERVTAKSAQIDFSTAQEVKATLLCATTKTAVKFYCGEDTTPVTKHSILTSDYKVTLNTGQGYYVYSNITADGNPFGYIPAYGDNPTFGLKNTMYTNESLGLCLGDEGFDPQLDVNQDGCVNTSDLVETLPGSFINQILINPLGGDWYFS